MLGVRYLLEIIANLPQHFKFAVIQHLHVTSMRRLSQQTAGSIAISLSHRR
jgi:hypothetical protein